MRKDMAKVIVERPRHNSRHGHFTPGRARALTDDDDAPLSVRVKPTRQAKTKHLNEHLGPLKRFLEKQVGRPWDKVYSEVSANLKAANPVQQHVRDHLDDFVAVRTRMENGKVMSQHPYLGPVGLEREWRRFYVHPKTGLLRRNPHWATWAAKRKADAAAKAAERAKRMRSVSSYVQLHKLDDGGWWEITLKDFGAEPARDAVLAAGLSTLPAEELYGRGDIYAARKRPLSKKEKRALGLI
ncbi:MAG: hypothetical protein HXY28_10445 [Hydrogenophilaceae bacterium]|jgi:hypothetical protein|nr:hypothetical protein [Hydrogenophilaceae bacterium]